MKDRDYYIAVLATVVSQIHIVVLTIIYAPQNHFQYWLSGAVISCMLIGAFGYMYKEGYKTKITARQYNNGNIKY